uniref:Putative secreted protein n=1 Tax=Anopheles darlingi TaxID=43151 RepID=A0A2M4DAY3_ANODA
MWVRFGLDHFLLVAGTSDGSAYFSRVGQPVVQAKFTFAVYELDVAAHLQSVGRCLYAAEHIVYIVFLDDGSHRSGKLCFETSGVQIFDVLSVARGTRGAKRHPRHHILVGLWLAAVPSPQAALTLLIRIAYGNLVEHFGDIGCNGYFVLTEPLKHGGEGH